MTVFAIGRANLGLAREITTLGRVYRKSVGEKDEFLLKAVNTNMGTLYTMFKEDHVRRLLGENGIGPYLGPPGTRVRQEIEAFAKEMNITTDSAREALRGSLQRVSGNDA